jgi:hypothetical protein
MAVVDGGGATGTDAAGGAGVSDAGQAGSGDVTIDSILSGCVLLLHMDELSWSGTPKGVIDATAFHNDGTAQGDATTTDVNAKFGRAGHFTGNGWVTVPDALSLEPATAVSYAAWVYPTGLDDPPSEASAPGDAPGIIAKRTNVNDAAFTMFFWAQNHLYVDIDSANDRFHSTTMFQNNTWYHVAVVYDGRQPQDQRVRLYVNGVLEVTAFESSGSIPTNTADVFIGTLPNGGLNFVGIIDEVAIWTRPLDDMEVAFLYNTNQPL